MIDYVIFCVILASVSATDIPEYHPLYNFRYQNQELMKTSASNLPIGKFNIEEGSNVPERYFDGYKHFDRFGPRGFEYFGGNYYQPFLSSFPYYGSVRHFGGLGGGIVDKNIYSGENRKTNGESFENAEGNKGQSGGHVKTGFNNDAVALKNSKDDSGFYIDEAGAKKGADDAKFYQGGQQYQNGGENAQNKKVNASNKKGHSKKGFRTSHHKDESGKTETFYDEANDEGSNYNYDNNQGSFGQKGQTSYKGGHDDGQFERNEKSKQGHFENRHIIDNANADKGAYDQKGFHGNGEIYRINNGIGQHSLLGRQESNREFFHHHPFGHHPFNPGY